MTESDGTVAVFSVVLRNHHTDSHSVWTSFEYALFKIEKCPSGVCFLQPAKGLKNSKIIFLYRHLYLIGQSLRTKGLGAQRLEPAAESQSLGIRQRRTGLLHFRGGVLPKTLQWLMRWGPPAPHPCTHNTSQNRYKFSNLLRPKQQFFNTTALNP